MPWLGNMQSAFGTDEPIGNTMRVEEDWYIQIGTPEPKADSPQITTVIAPAQTLDGCRSTSQRPITIVIPP